LIEGLAADGLIDATSNLSGKPIHIIAGTDDVGSTPALLDIQKNIFEVFGANVDLLTYTEGPEAGHTTSWLDPRATMQHIFPAISATGMSSSSDVGFSNY
jgi:pimeloyl-ACP methyl ester carboxylesterase